MDIGGIFTIIKQVIDTVVEVIPAFKAIYEGITSPLKKSLPRGSGEELSSLSQWLDGHLISQAFQLTH